MERQKIPGGIRIFLPRTDHTRICEECRAIYQLVGELVRNIELPFVKGLQDTTRILERYFWSRLIAGIIHLMNLFYCFAPKNLYVKRLEPQFTAFAEARSRTLSNSSITAQILAGSCRLPLINKWLYQRISSLQCTCSVSTLCFLILGADNRALVIHAACLRSTT